jgi:8-oxo-dGTP pyrophosphatase MutT (NUDIX family)
LPFRLSFAETATALEASLRQPLPGASAQAALAPRLPREWPAGLDPAHVRSAAGLLLLVPIGIRPHVVLTVRTDTLDHHRGQISLPGGMVEPGESAEQAALREAQEEIALPLEGVRVLGPLTPLDIPVSGFRLHPIVAIADPRPRLMAAQREVARILEVAVEDLMHPAGLVAAARVRDRRSMAVPAFRVAGHEVWGATAMVLAEFLTLLGWRGKRAT